MIPCYKTDSMPGIYLFTNRVNGKRYIGQSKNVYLRFFRHKEPQEDMVFHLALAKHGWDAFDWTFLERMPNATKDDLNQREQHWILHYRTNEKSFGYNRVLPLDCPIRREHAMRNIRRINTEGLNKNRPHYPATSITRLRMSNAKKGLKRTDTEKACLREKNLGNKNHFYGKHHKRTSIEQGNCARELTAFLNPKPHPATIHLKVQETSGAVTYLSLAEATKRFHLDRRDLKDLLDKGQSPPNAQVTYATSDEVQKWLKILRQTRWACANAYGTPTYW